MTPLEKAKDVERNASTSTYISIRLCLLQDLIAEIERLEGAVVLATKPKLTALERSAFKEEKN